MISRIILLFVLSILLAGCTQNSELLTISFWNVENLFDLVDNPEKNDEEFALNGRKSMTQEILDLKLEHMSEVLTDLNADVLGLCEVENLAVLQFLNEHYTERNYDIVHYESPDSRGIDVALLCDSNRLQILDSKPIPIAFDDGRPTRDILYVRAESSGVDLHLFVNHWPSNYIGTELAIPRRIKVAKVLRQEIDNILMADPLAEILLMGDFNENPSDTAVQEVLNATLEQDHLSADSFNLWNAMGKFVGVERGGTYVYRGQDSILDHIIISSGLLNKSGLVYVDESVIINDAPKYRQQEGDYEGYPFRFWAGDNLLGGYSDHLAVSIKLKKAE